MNRKQRLLSIVLACTILSAPWTFAACSKKESSTHKKAKKTPSTSSVEEADLEEESTETSPSTSTTTCETLATCTPTPTLSPEGLVEAEKKAISIAAEHGMTQEDLRGKYELFLRYADTIENNNKLGDFRHYVYLLFPMVADHLKEEYEKEFLFNLSWLKIVVGPISIDLFGQYDKLNTITINSLAANDGSEMYNTGVMHELIHFLDDCICGHDNDVAFGKDRIYTLDIEGFENSDPDDKIYDGRFLKEGFTTLYTAKYYSTVIPAYQIPVQFLTGFEHIYGSEIMDELFFGPNTSYEMAEILYQNGMEIEEIRMFYETMTAITLGDSSLPRHYVRPEDVLIRLYENQIGPDYQDDPIFCFILSSFYDEDEKYTLHKYPSQHDDFLTSIEMDTEEAQAWLRKNLRQVERAFPDIILHNDRIRGIYLDGKFTLNLIVKMGGVDGILGPDYVLNMDYDFETGKTADWSIEPIPFEDYP